MMLHKDIIKTKFDAAVSQYASNFQINGMNVNFCR